MDDLMYAVVVMPGVCGTGYQQIGGLGNDNEISQTYDSVEYVLSAAERETDFLVGDGWSRRGDLVSFEADIRLQRAAVSRGGGFALSSVLSGFWAAQRRCLPSSGHCRTVVGL